MRPTVLLFDIDGTLVTTGGAGRRAMQRGFASLHGRPDAVDFRMDGMTDRMIVRSGLSAIAVEPTQAVIDDVLAAYIDALRDEVPRVPDELYRVHQGAREAIALALRSGAAVGLGTGNVREGASVKLTRAGLFESFRFGGFGCDSEDRTELLRIGANRGAAELCRPVHECRVVVIGDTPKDIAAARGIGAECLAVATGFYSTEVLRATGATAVFSDLSSEQALKTLLEG